jgi:hypothetical protein
LLDLSKTRRKVQARAATKERVKNNSKRTHSGEWEWKNHVPYGMTPSTRSSKARITIGA